MARALPVQAATWPVSYSWFSTATFVMAVMIIGFGSWILAPIVVVLVNSFNLAPAGQPAIWTLENWVVAFSQPDVLKALGNTFLVYFGYTVIGFPIGVLIAWTLARTDITKSPGFEFMFWLSFMLPSISTTVGWVFLLDPDVGLLNKGIELLPFVEDSPFNIYSLGGIIWTHLMANTISGAVMLLTPAFRNMDSALEEASRASGASNLQTMMRVTFPVMVPPIILVFMRSLVRIFQSFETEQILGTPINFYVYSTKIFQFIRYFDPPRYGTASALASIVLVVIAIIVPTQRWLTTRKRYTVVTGQFKPGLIRLGPLRPLVLGVVGVIVALLTVLPVLTLVGGSFMTRVGWFTSKPLFTFTHYQEVLTDHFFLTALKNTFVLSASTAIVSPLLFSLVAYVLVRTEWRGRTVLDSLMWMSTALPGILSGLGLLWLFLGTPILTPLYGTMYALVLVVILQGKLTSTQLVKGVYLQVGSDMEEAARVLGSGWWTTYFRIWIPLLMPTLVLIGVFNFVIAAGATSSIILLAERGTKTLSILALELMSRSDGADLEGAGIVSLVIVALTAGLALIARRFGLKVGVRHI